MCCVCVCVCEREGGNKRIKRGKVRGLLHDKTVVQIFFLVLQHQSTTLTDYVG